MDWPRVNSLSRALLPKLVLPLILAVALALRLYGIGWDEGYGFHPDERSIYMRADCMFRLLAESPGYSDCIREYPETEPGIPGLGTFFDNEKSPLNPHWFPLGTIILYLLVLFRSVIELFMDPRPLLHMAYAGRTFAALADVAGIVLVYLLGKRMYGRGAGLLAAALVALAVIHIQISHFYRPETLLVFLLLTSFWFMLQVMEKRRLRDSLFLGLSVGLVFAVKVSVLPIFLPLVLAYGFRVGTTPDGGWHIPSRKEYDKVLLHACAGALVAGTVFTAALPYAVIPLLQPSLGSWGAFTSWLNGMEFVGWITREADIARNAGIVPYTKQYIDTTPFLYELKQSSVWGLGLPLGIVAWGGLLFTLIFTAYQLIKRGVLLRAQVLFLAWVVPNIVLLALFDVKFLRYIFPMIPFLIIMGSGMLFWMLSRARSLSSSTHTPGRGLTEIKNLFATYASRIAVGTIAFVVLATGFYALAFERIYSRPHPAIAASRWINENVPRGTNIVSDNHWDEFLPDLYSYNVTQIPIYETDTFGKMNTIAGYLAEGEYLAFYSNRTYGSVSRIPDEYPFSSRYYKLLFSEKLGYTLDRSFTSYPELLGVAFVDDTFGRAGIPEPKVLRESKPAPLSLNLGYADNDVITYDHPKVLLFKNEGRLHQSQIFNILTSVDSGQEAGAPTEVGLMMDTQRRVAQQEGGTWSDIIERGSWTNKIPVLAWLLLVELIYLAALPLAYFVFRPLPDRGIILARILGILGVAYVVWVLASIGWMSFSRASILVAILVIAALSAVVLKTKWMEFAGYLRANWRLLAIAEVLFLVAFLAFVAIRAANPDLWHPFRGGEKPMDFAYLNAVLRSTYMPPYDPWFAGGYLNYYYWGQFIVATLIKGTGIVPSVAYNLAVPLLFALTVTGAYSIVYNVAAGMGRVRELVPSPFMGEGQGEGERYPLPLTPSRKGRQNFGAPHPEERETTPSPFTGEGWGEGENRGVAWGPVAAGLLAGLFVAVMGNLDGLVQLVEGAWKDVVRGDGFPAFDFWRSSRMLPAMEDVTPSALTFWLPDKLHPDIGFHITEFPYFSFLFADLHAHMIVIPFSVLAVGLGLSLLVGIARAGRGWWLVITTITLGVAVGSLWGINSWDYPSYMLLGLLMIGIGVYLRPGSSRERAGLFLATGLGMGLVSFLAFLPFHNSYDPSATGIEVSKWQTPIHNYLGIHGLFLFLSMSFLVYISRTQLRNAGGQLLDQGLGGVGLSRLWDAPASFPPRSERIVWAVGLGVPGVLVVVYMAAAGYWTAAMLVVLLGFTVWAAKGVASGRGEGAGYALFPMALLVLALLMEIGVEFIRVKEDIGRMNTLFKYYLQAWVLFGIASAYMLWYLGSRGAFSPRGLSIGRGLWLGALVVLLASSFVYTILGTRARLADRFNTGDTTLDGASYMREAVHSEEGVAIDLRWDYEGIKWLQDNVSGSPVVLEAHNTQYRWSSRIANYTGLPTVLGWPWHQIQQRKPYDFAVRDRSADVREIYSTSRIDRALELLRLYEVQYVVVGELERAYYPATGVEKFDTMAQQGLAELVYQNEGLRIYRGTW